MKKFRFALPFLFCILLALPAIPFQAGKTSPGTPRPIELTDIQAWKSISSPTLSNDGQWFAYRIDPREGDGEVVVRNTKSAKELRFPAGSISGAGGRGAGGRGGGW